MMWLIRGCWFQAVLHLSLALLLRRKQDPEPRQRTTQQFRETKEASWSTAQRKEGWICLVPEVSEYQFLEIAGEESVALVLRLRPCLWVSLGGTWLATVGTGGWARWTTDLIHPGSS